MGRITLEASTPSPNGSILLWAGMPLIALILHAAIQQIVFYRVVLENAAEGLHNRGVTARKALIGGIVVAVFCIIGTVLLPTDL